MAKQRFENENQRFEGIWDGGSEEIGYQVNHNVHKRAL